MSKKTHPHYSWLLHYNEYKEESQRYAYFPQEDLNSYKNGNTDPGFANLRIVFGSSPSECYKKANDKFSTEKTA